MSAQPRSETSTRVLTATGITKTYRRGSERVVALEGVSFSLDAGEFVTVSGPSGSGKTTLVNVLAGWETPDVGEVRWTDGDVDPAAPAWGALASAPQRLGLLDELSVHENVELPLRLRDGADRADTAEQVGAALETFGLHALAHRLPSEVSLGEQQRTALARALVGRPRVLLADEPTGHQDAGWAAGVIAGLQRARERGTAVLVATHDEEVIVQADRAVELHDGRVVTPA